MITWRPIHKKRFEAILLEITSALAAAQDPAAHTDGVSALTSLAAATVFDAASLTLSSLPVGEEEFEVAPAAIEIDGTADPAAIEKASAADEGLSAPVAESDDAAETLAATEVEPDGSESSLASDLPARSQQEAAVEETSEKKATAAEAAAPIKEKEPEAQDNRDAGRVNLLEVPAKRFFATIPWGGGHVGDAGFEAADFAVPQSKPVAARPARPVEVPRSNAAAALFFKSLPWSGEVSQQADEAPETLRIQLETNGEDTGAPIDEAPSAHNMLMAGMLSAARTSRRIQAQQGAPGSAAHQSPERTRASEFFNHLNWKKSA